MEHREPRVYWAFRGLTAHKSLKVLPDHRGPKGQGNIFQCEHKTVPATGSQNPVTILSPAAPITATLEELHVSDCFLL